MRVIAGKYKGRTLFPPKGDRVRPTTDRIKENVFNLIQGKVAGAAFLDLFGGSGAMSIEALSRGAARTVTVDAAEDSIALIKKNFQKMGVGAEGQVVKQSYDVALKSLTNTPFDVIYLDPPYLAEFVTDVLDKIVVFNVLAKDGVVVYEHATATDFCYEGGLERIDSRKYGSVTIEIFKRP